MMRQKKPRYTSKRYLEYISDQECLFCWTTPCQAHHLLKPWIGDRGMGMRADDRNVVPLCFPHHHELHTIYGSEKKMAYDYLFEDDFFLVQSQKLWENSPFCIKSV